MNELLEQCDRILDLEEKYSHRPPPFDSYEQANIQIEADHIAELKVKFGTPAALALKIAVDRLEYIKITGDEWGNESEKALNEMYSQFKKGSE